MTEESDSLKTRDAIVKAAFRHRDALLAMAFAIVRDWDLAEDAVHDAFLVVMDKWEEFDPQTQLFAWVRTIVRYKALEIAKKMKRRLPFFSDELLDLVADTLEEKIDEGMAEQHRRMRNALAECMKMLSRSAIAILDAFYHGQESCLVIAERMGKTENAVRLLLSRSRKQLRECAERRIRHTGA